LAEIDEARKSIGVAAGVGAVLRIQESMHVAGVGIALVLDAFGGFCNSEAIVENLGVVGGPREVTRILWKVKGVLEVNGSIVEVAFYGPRLDGGAFESLAVEEVLGPCCGQSVEGRLGVIGQVPLGDAGLVEELEEVVYTGRSYPIKCLALGGSRANALKVEARSGSVGCRMDLY